MCLVARMKLDPGNYQCYTFLGNIHAIYYVYLIMYNISEWIIILNSENLMLAAFFQQPK